MLVHPDISDDIYNKLPLRPQRVSVRQYLTLCVSVVFHH